MKDNIELFIRGLLQQHIDELFSSNLNLKQVVMGYINDSGFISRSINLLIEKRITCPDGTIMVSDENKEISHYSNRTPEEKNFADEVKSADKYLELVFGSYRIVANRNQLFEAHSV